MNTCLLCDEDFSSPMKFQQLFLLQVEKQQVCPTCWSQFERISDQHCPTCYKNLEEQVCSDCLYWQKRAREVQHRSCFLYNAAMKDYFSRYKFQGDYLLRQVFAELLRQELRKFSDYLLVPIPVSSERLAKRGFNQVEGLLDATGLSYKNILKKEDSLAQSSKNRQERLLSKQTFSLMTQASLSSKILLIDDIYTTGATLQQAKQILSENGVKEILTFSLAR